MTCKAFDNFNNVTVGLACVVCVHRKNNETAQVENGFDQTTARHIALAQAVLIRSAAEKDDCQSFSCRENFLLQNSIFSFSQQQKDVS